jgi:hypothetical protein
MILGQICPKKLLQKENDNITFLNALNGYSQFHLK